jgi:hypothetical protein
MDHQVPEQSLRVDSNMSLSSINFFEGVETADSAYARARNRLAVDNQCAWFSVTPSSAPSRPTRDAQNAPDAPFLSPTPEIVIDGLPPGKFARQHAPLRPRLNDVQDGIQNVVSQVVLPASTGRKVTFDLFPLGVRQVGVVALLAHGSDKSFSEKLAGFIRKRGGLPSVFGNGC